MSEALDDHKRDSVAKLGDIYLAKPQQREPASKMMPNAAGSGARRAAVISRLCSSLLNTRISVLGMDRWLENYARPTIKHSTYCSYELYVQADAFNQIFLQEMIFHSLSEGHVHHVPQVGQRFGSEAAFSRLVAGTLYQAKDKSWIYQYKVDGQRKTKRFQKKADAKAYIEALIRKIVKTLVSL